MASRWQGISTQASPQHPRLPSSYRWKHHTIRVEHTLVHLHLEVGGQRDGKVMSSPSSRYVFSRTQSMTSRTPTCMASKAPPPTSGRYGLAGPRMGVYSVSTWRLNSLEKRFVLLRPYNFTQSRVKKKRITLPAAARLQWHSQPVRRPEPRQLSDTHAPRTTGGRCLQHAS